MEVRIVPVFLLVIGGGVANTLNSTFQLTYEWKSVNFTWPSPDDYRNSSTNGTYIPGNTVVAGIKVHKDRIYLAMPRARPGTPVTLGYINATEKDNPLVTPYPDWNANIPDDCTKLESVQSMEIDPEGVMWVLDGFRVKPDSKCPPKLLLLDLEARGRVLEIHTFPEHICSSRGGFLNDLVVDGDHAYITDNSNVDPGLIVFSRTKKRAWKLRDASMFAETRDHEFAVGGEVFGHLAPIDGIALSPNTSSAGVRDVYYCALAGFGLYSIGTDVLKDEVACSGGEWRARVKFVGRKQAQSDGMVVDSKGDLYYGLLPLYGVGKWNVNEDFSRATIVERDNPGMAWTDSFSIDEKGDLFLLANNINKFFNAAYKFNKTEESLIRIFKLSTGNKSYLY